MNAKEVVEEWVKFMKEWIPLHMVDEINYKKPTFYDFMEYLARNV